MKIALKEELVANCGFERWTPSTPTRPVNWANRDGNAISYVLRWNDAQSGNYSCVFYYGPFTGVLESNVMPVVNEANVQYDLSFWYKVESYSSGYGVVRITEHDSEMTELNTFYPLTATSNCDWTQITKTIGHATSDADYKLNVDTKYIRVNLMVYDTPQLIFGIDNFTIGGARFIELDKGYTFPFNSQTNIIGKQAETSGGNLLGIEPYNTQNQKVVSFEGFKADHDRLINFLESQEVQYGKYPFWLRDENENWSLIRYKDNIFKSKSPAHGTYSYGFLFTEEL